MSIIAKSCCAPRTKPKSRLTFSGNVTQGGCPAPLKIKEERKGNDLSGAFIGVQGTVMAMVTGWLVCACNTCEGGCNRWLVCPQGVMWWQL